jgi:hypothetical protein
MPSTDASIGDVDEQMRVSRHTGSQCATTQTGMQGVDIRAIHDDTGSKLLSLYSCDHVTEHSVKPFVML